MATPACCDTLCVYLSAKLPVKSFRTLLLYPSYTRMTVLTLCVPLCALRWRVLHLLLFTQFSLSLPSCQFAQCCQL